MIRAALAEVHAQAVSRAAMPSLREYDPWLLGSVAAIAGFGLVMLTSASIMIGDRLYGDPFHFLLRQIVALGIGVTLALVAARTPLETMERASSMFLLLGVFLLVLVVIPGLGKEVNGSLRWLALGPVTMQPSEPAKLCFVIYLAGYLVRHADSVRNEFVGFIKPIVLVTIMGALLLIEPDYGTAAVLIATALGMLFLGGVSLSRFCAWGAIASTALLVMAIKEPYRVARLATFMDPWADPFASGFQLTQALIAFGRGEWFGVGLGASVQKLFYLPEVHTDFIFAIVGEELGFAGTCTLIAAYAFLVWRIFHIGARALAADQPFGAYLSYGVGLIIGLQAFVNMGVNMGVLPTKGLTLPLMSYGANSLLFTAASIGLVARVALETNAPLAARAPVAGGRS
ncbi:MAG: putative lipid II flippase FtsW [Gammaproteobacteria bacterium]